jgi:hypothetical protein
MIRAVELFIAVSAAVVGLSHALQPAMWARIFARLSARGRRGAYANGAITLVPGVLLVFGHQVWTWPATPLTAFGWLVMAKALMCFVAPERVLASMRRGSRAPRGFIAAGVLLLGVSAWAAYCLASGIDSR